MKYLLWILLILGSAWACSSAGSEEALAPDGREIYKTYCITCHGATGNLGGNGAFDLSASALSVEQRVQVITEGRNTMASFRTLLEPEKIQAVAEYTMSFKKS